MLTSALTFLALIASTDASQAADCAAGTYWHTKGSVDCAKGTCKQTTATCCCACHASYYCPGGASSQPELPCPAGSTSPPNSTAESDCTGGPPGPPGPGGACSPQMFFINYAESPSQMRVSWTTTCKAGAVVNFGTSKTSLSPVTGDAPTTYTFGSYTSPYIYHVTLDGLTPGATYFYTVGDATSGVSPIMTFKAHPGKALVPGFVQAIIGDLGQTVNSESTIQHVQANPDISFVMHVGDLSYADAVETRWDSWQTLVAPLTQTIPYMVQVGNHEEEKGNNPFIAYASRFAMPAPASGVDTTWYSLDIAGVHWITLSNYHDFASGSPQYNWLKADLAAIDSSVTPWVFVNTHAPWYNTNSAHQGDGEAQRVALEKMLYDAGVDGMFMGHVHAYERSHRAYNNQRDPKGPFYITIGDGGNREGLAANWLAQTPISAYRFASFGHLEITIANATHAHLDWHQNPDAETTSKDSIWVVKGQDM